MKIILNGQNRDFDSILTLENLIGQFSPDNPRIIAEINGQIIKSSEWSKTTIKEGDSIELVSFVGGG